MSEKKTLNEMAGNRKEFDAGIDDELAKIKGAQILIITAQQKKKIIIIRERCWWVTSTP